MSLPLKEACSAGWLAAHADRIASMQMDARLQAPTGATSVASLSERKNFDAHPTHTQDTKRRHTIRDGPAACDLSRRAHRGIIADAMPILDERMLDFTSRSPEQTRRLGMRLGELLRGGECICLEGELGAGKTVLAQGIAAGWGVTDPVRSPTFTLIHEFRRPGDRCKLYHADLYRITGASEAWALGLDDVWVRLEPDGNVCLIEWPERAATILPVERLWVRLAVLDDTRRQLQFTAQGERHQPLLDSFKRAAFGG